MKKIWYVLQVKRTYERGWVSFLSYNFTSKAKAKKQIDRYRNMGSEKIYKIVRVCWEHKVVHISRAPKI